MKRIMVLAALFCLPALVFAQVSILDTVYFNQYSQPMGVAVNWGTNLIYVTLQNEGTVGVIDGATNTVLTNIAVGGNPIAIGANPNTNMIYVVNNDDDNVHVIDGSTQTVIDTIPVGWAPIAVAVDSINNFIYVLCDLGLEVDVISGTSHMVVDVVPLLDYDYPNDIAFNEITDLVFVTHGAAGYVSVIEAYFNVLIDTFTVGGPYIAGLDVYPGFNFIFIANQATDTVLVVSGISNIVIAAIGVGIWPDAIRVNPSTGNVFVANTGSDNMSVIDGFLHTLIGTVPAGAEPMRLGVHPGTNRIYLSCRMMDAVIVYGDQGAVEEHPIHEPRRLSVEVTPNPFRDKVSIYGMYDVGCKMYDNSIQILDLSGRVVKEFPISEFPNFQVEWDGKDVAPGVYFLTIDGLVKKKIVKIE
jgi:YVTN family beta-propeller protein